MNIFLSYASEDRDTAQAVALALRAQGHDMFFDREDLAPDDEYNARIRHAIDPLRRTDLGPLRQFPGCLGEPHRSLSGAGRHRA